ncbi:DNA excision repair protein ERCC-6 [Halocaridina rubra]|uniref:DNA repair and recombination protein RAD54-like n=1 Tax=Halocaridina rubra TaxID=373956 RepID=A0AAN8X951_HALRR
MEVSNYEGLLHSIVEYGNETNAANSKPAGDEDFATKENIVAQDLQDQDNELRALGISVVDQLSLEKDVEAAVNKVVTVHARKQRMQMLKKEIQDVKKEIKQGDLKLNVLSERLSAMRRRVVDPRHYINVEKEFKNKDEQIKALKTREESLQQMLAHAEVNEEVLDDYDLEEGEIIEDGEEPDEIAIEEAKTQLSGDDKEKLIREGKMTPFGTVMAGSASMTVSVKRSSFSKLRNQKPVSKPQKATNAKGPSKEDMVSSGEMTPFGSVVKTTEKSKDKFPKKSSIALNDFEKYLQDQIDRQKAHGKNNYGVMRKKSAGNPNYGIPKKHKKPKEYVGIFDHDLEGNNFDDGVALSAIKKNVKSKFELKMRNTKVIKKPPKRKDPIKMNVLHPKQKKRKKENLGTVTSELEADQYKDTPRRILSERVSIEESGSEYSDVGEASDSEYLPSDENYENDDYSTCSKDDDNILPKVTNIVKEKKDRPKRKREKRIKSSDEWSDDEIPKPKGRKSLKEIDDGNIDDYIKRIERWKEERLRAKHAKILRGEDLDSEEEEEEGYEEFEGGYKVPLAIWNKLYKYQKTCVKWLWELHCQVCGGILGDEMGLGKTIQIISFLVGLSYSRLTHRQQRWKGLGPVLIVCPATVLHQWVKEFHKWWPPFRVAILHESGSFVGKRADLVHNINKYDGILITSYTGLHSQLDILLRYNWHYLILDEGHKIRNPEAQITIAVKRFETPHRLILSGSPIQNSLKELWSLFDFVFPGKLGTLPVFLSEFAVPITHGGYANASKLEVQTAFKCASVLRDTINPYLLRRMKNDVRNHLSLPDKNEQVLFCSLSEEQRQAYQEYINGDQVKWIMGGRMKVFVGLINLRKICNHPDLYTGGPRNYDGYESGLQPELKYGWWGRSGKMHVLQAILRLWSKQGHRVLLFTQSRQMMCILEKFLIDEKYTYLKMDGTTSVSSRQPLIEKFNGDPTYLVFLLTTRVGGLGVNLTGADRVVIYDPDWNPSTDSQARERAWRIGQLRHVTIYRLLTSGTIEEKIYHRQIFKQFLTNRVLKDPKQQRFFKTNDLYELFTLNEGYKEKTESSAIFAGTDSEIKVNVNKKASDSSAESRDTIKLADKLKSDHVKSAVKDRMPRKQTKENTLKQERYPLSKTPKKESATKKSDGNVENTLTSDSSKLDSKQVERMKALAKMISQSIGKRTEDTDIKNNILLKKSYPSSEVLSDCCNNEKIVSKHVKPDNNKEDMLTRETDLKDDIENEEEIVEKNCINEEKEEDCENSFNLNSSSCNLNGYKDVVSCVLEEINSEDSVKVLKEENSISNKLLSHDCSSENNSNSSRPSNSRDCANDKPSEKQRKNHKKKDKHKEMNRDKEEKGHREKRSHKRGRKLDGERIDYLVKKHAYQKSAAEEEAERENAKSQDEYVLSKLFQKSGVHTALSHDSILSNSDPDYLLMEGEAERVAKEALKAVRASRTRITRPWDSSRADCDIKKKKPKFGNKKNKMFTDSPNREINIEKDVKSVDKKVRMFNGGIDEDSDVESEGVFLPKKKPGSDTSGGMSSAQLLSRMYQRNKTVGSLELDEAGSDSGYDPDYPSTATLAEEVVDPDMQENIDLLADIRNFVAFQAEVDGSASTQEIINRFKSRLPPQQTPFFKALLTQICDFHRKPTGEGIWSLKGEFR